MSNKKRFKCSDKGLEIQQTQTRPRPLHRKRACLWMTSVSGEGGGESPCSQGWLFFIRIPEYNFEK